LIEEKFFIRGGKDEVW